MNIRMLIFSGIMTALVGSFLGLVVAHIAERESRRPAAVIVGTGLGFAIGVGYEAMQQNRERETD
ncbi:hypothetical protein [Pleurocapsa sp. FMAR1]|uniref:hypothetical protein n=1 Tax=Pleurocapsa sp. FMAR1 TaxID=3040204 RepID=UPI0029C7D663|nr:hypothetical protein [Pleurocapsa sp. FMAR1]